jgi:hypothetical protein
MRCLTPTPFRSLTLVKRPLHPPPRRPQACSIPFGQRVEHPTCRLISLTLVCRPLLHPSKPMGTPRLRRHHTLWEHHLPLPTMVCLISLVVQLEANLWVCRRVLVLIWVICGAQQILLLVAMGSISAIFSAAPPLCRQ